MITKKTQIISLFFCVLTLFVSLFWKQIYVNSILFFMPKKERGHLEHFFHYLNIEGFPWVAKEIKPVLTFDDLSNIEFTLIYPHISVLDRYNELCWDLHPIYARMRAGLRVWKKYSWLFPSNKIAIVSKTPYLIQAWETVLVVNIKATKKVIADNYQEFVDVLGYSFSIDQLMRRLIDNPNDYIKNLKGSEYLMGILYGFGKSNAVAFQRRSEPYSFNLPPYLKHYPKMDDYEGERTCSFLELDKIEVLFDPNNPWFRPPGFVVDPDSQDTKDLEQKYSNFFEKIAKEKCGKSELKWSLLQLF